VLQCAAALQPPATETYPSVPHLDYRLKKENEKIKQEKLSIHDHIHINGCDCAKTAHSVGFERC
jgi:hypothetical protein